MSLTEGVGVVPDVPASAGTPTEQTVTTEVLPPVIPAVPEEQNISDALETEVAQTSEEENDLLKEFESAIEANPNDSDLVKKLRGLVKTKYEDFQSKAKETQTPELDAQTQEAIDLVNGLFEFDTQLGEPTTKKFAEAIAKKDINLAEKAFSDLANVALDDSGFTIGHKFLQLIGLDPYKIDQLREFSQGKLDPVDYGMVKVHDRVPKEKVEAYKSLTALNRTDVDLYLDSDEDIKVQAGLQVLRDRQSVIDNQKFKADFEQRQTAQLHQEVGTATESDLNTTYTGVLNALKANPAYVNVKISSDPTVDSMVKDSLISQLNALGDPRSVLAQQAMRTFEARGVKVDVAKIESLMNTIENSTLTAITAERQGKLQGRNYSTQIQEALARKSAAVSQLTALGNRYFSQALAHITGTPTQPNPAAAPPNIPNTNTPAPEQRRPGIKTMSELDAEILSIANTLQAAQ